MAAHAHKNGPAHRYKHHISGVGGNGTQHTGYHYRKGDNRLGYFGNKQAQTHGNHAGVFGNTNAQHHNQYKTKRWKIGKSGNHFCENHLDTFARQ